MIRRTAAAIARPSVSVLTILTGATGAIVAVEINLTAGLVLAAILGTLSAAITKEQ